MLTPITALKLVMMGAISYDFYLQLLGYTGEQRAQIGAITC